MRLAQLAVGIGLSLWSILYLVQNIPLQDTWAALLKAKPEWLALGIVTLMLAMLAKVFRWGLLFHTAGPVSRRGLLSATFIGYMVNTVAPFRVGELVRAYLAAVTERVGLGTSLATVLLEKVLDVLAILLIFGGLVLAVPLPPWASTTGQGAGAVFLMGIVALIGVIRWRRGLTALVLRMEEAFPLARRVGAARQIASFLDTLAVLRFGNISVPVIGWSAAIWGLSAMINYFIMVAMEVPVPISAALLLLVVTNLGMTVPSAPAYVGVFHYLTVQSLSAFGVEPSHALALALVLHTSVFGTFVLVGLFFLWQGNYRVVDLWRGAEGASAGVARPVP